MSEDPSHERPPAGASGGPRSAEREVADALQQIASGETASAEPAAETELWAGRTHWKHFAGRVLGWVVANLLAAVLVGWITHRLEGLRAVHGTLIILALVLISGLLVLGQVALRILACRYRLTSQRLFISRGILSQTVDQTELIRVDDVRIYKSFLDRVLGLGTVAVVSTDASDREVTITGIRDPDHVAEAIRKHMRVLRRKSLFVENL